MNRRKLLRTILGLTGIGTLTGLYTWQIEPFWLEFVNVDMPIQNLPADLEGKTLMQISDIHVGEKIDRQYTIESFEKAIQLAPDFVVYTGDFINAYRYDTPYEELKEIL